MAKNDKKDILEKLVPVLLILTIGLAFVVGILWQKVSDMQSGTTNVASERQADKAAPSKPANGKLSEAQAEKVPGLKENDHVKGSRDAKVFIIEYSDFECPFCQSFHPTAQQAVDEYGGDVAWIYRHFPLDTLHPRARPAAEASECVADLGGNDAFWSFADYVFENQSSSTLSDSGLADAATQAGVNTSSFNDCFESERFADLVEEEYQEGLDAGVTGTPGNFIVNTNGDVWFIPGAVAFDENSEGYRPGSQTLKSVIDEALSN